MAQQTVESNDNLNAGRIKINENFTEVYQKSNTAQSEIDAHEALTNNPHSVTKTQVGLGDVDNTSDASKPVSTATQTALDAKVPTTRTVNGHPLSANVTLTASDVGLGNVNNTSDLDKPISTAVQAALETINKVLVTGAVVLDSTAFGKWHQCSGTTAGYTITLPTAIGNEGKMILIKGSGDSTVLNQVVTIDGDGTERIDNYFTRSISTGGHISLVANVTAGVGSWEVVAFEQGAWITFAPSFPSGYTVAPTFVGKYYVRGKTLTWYQTATAHGTGTGTAVTQTVPGGFTAANETRNVSGSIINNGAVTTVPGLISSHVGSTTMDLYPNTQNGTSWTGSNGRSLSGTFTIEIQ